MTPFAINMAAWFTPSQFKHTAGRQFVTPKARKQSDKGRDWLESLDIQSFQGPLGEQRAYLSGSRPQVFFQHGWEADSADLSTHAQAAQAAGFDVALIDGPAHGASAGRRATMVDFAAGLGAAARTFGQPKAVVAHSMGLPSTVLAITEQGLSPRLVISLGAPDALPDNVRFQSRAMGLSRHATTLLMESIEHRLGRSIESFNVANDAGALPPGALILHGADDQIVPTEAGERLAAAWPQARLELIEGLGHRGILRDARAVKAVVDALVAADL